MNTRIILLTICISSLIFGLANATFPSCSPSNATQPYEDTLFMFFIHRGHEDHIRAQIWYILKLVTCFIEKSPDFQAIIVDFSQELAGIYAPLNIENLQTTLANVNQQQSNEPVECRYFQTALESIFNSFGQEKQYKHFEVIVPNLRGLAPDCDLLTMFNDYRDNHIQDVEKVHPMVIPMSTSSNGVCLDIQNPCLEVNEGEEPQAEVAEYFRNLATSFNRPRINGSSTASTSSAAPMTTSESTSATQPSSSTTLPPSTETTVTLIEQPTEDPIPPPRSRPISHPNADSDHPVQFWLSIFLLFLLFIAFLLTAWVIFRVWKLKQRLKKMDEWRNASREKQKQNKGSAEVSKTRSGSKERPSKSEKSKSKSKSKSQKSPSDRKKKKVKKTKTKSKKPSKIRSKSPVPSRENIV